LNFLDTFSKDTQISNVIIMRSVGVELFRTDRQTDGRDEVGFRIFFFVRA
jgi:hypothetical protein